MRSCWCGCTRRYSPPGWWKSGSTCPTRTSVKRNIWTSRRASSTSLSWTSRAWTQRDKSKWVKKSTCCCRRWPPPRRESFRTKSTSKMGNLIWVLSDFHYWRDLNRRRWSILGLLFESELIAVPALSLPAVGGLQGEGGIALPADFLIAIEFFGHGCDGGVHDATSKSQH